MLGYRIRLHATCEIGHGQFSLDADFEGRYAQARLMRTSRGTKFGFDPTKTLRLQHLKS
jgi:hypothetical protein